MDRWHFWPWGNQYIFGKGRLISQKKRVYIRLNGGLYTEIPGPIFILPDPESTSVSK